MKKETRQVSVTTNTFSDDNRKVQISRFADNVIISIIDTRITSSAYNTMPRVEVTIPVEEADKIFAHLLVDMGKLTYNEYRDEWEYLGSAQDVDLKLTSRPG